MRSLTQTVLPHALIGATLLLTMLTAQAEASPQICPIYPPEQWMPMPQVEDLARELGIETFYVQPEGGCWAIYYNDEDGTRWEFLLDPVTGLGVDLRRT